MKKPVEKTNKQNNTSNNYSLLHVGAIKNWIKPTTECVRNRAKIAIRKPQPKVTIGIAFACSTGKANFSLLKRERER